MNMESSIEFTTVINAVMLSLMAGLGTGLGGLIAIIRIPGKRAFGFLMGVTAGVMITLAFLELVNRAWEQSGFLTATIGFGLGAILMFLIDVLIPHMRFGEAETDGDEINEKAISEQGFGFRRQQHRQVHHRNHIHDHQLLKTGVLIAIGITIHNIPEGIAVGAGYIHQPRFGMFIALAILLHNIPEGIATALPLCCSGVWRWDAFRTSLLSGLSEPIGALIAALLLSNFQSLVPGALAFAGGVMVFITLDELIPVARQYGHQHFTAMGIITGAIFIFLLSGLLGI